MKVTPGIHWIKQGANVSGLGEILWRSNGSLSSGICSTEEDNPILNKAKDKSSLWVTVKWSGDRNYCHRIGAGGYFDLKQHTQCKCFYFHVYYIFIRYKYIFYRIISYFQF